MGVRKMIKSTLLTQLTQVVSLSITYGKLSGNCMRNWCNLCNTFLSLKTTKFNVFPLEIKVSK